MTNIEATQPSFDAPGRLLCAGRQPPASSDTLHPHPGRHRGQPPYLSQ